MARQRSSDLAHPFSRPRLETTQEGFVGTDIMRANVRAGILLVAATFLAGFVILEIPQPARAVALVLIALIGLALFARGSRWS